mgnify:CR=1 FL=1
MQRRQTVRAAAARLREVVAPVLVDLAEDLELPVAREIHLVVTFAGLAVVAVFVTAQRKPDGLWIVDPKTGCKIWDDLPAPNEVVSWSGDCRDGYAEGRGTAQWVIKGKPVDRYDGEMRAGKMVCKLDDLVDIPAVWSLKPDDLAAAQLAGEGGASALRGMVCLDEIRGRLAEVFSLKTYKIDHVVHGQQRGGVERLVELVVQGELSPGQAVRILTGAVVPEGSERVLPQELVQRITTANGDAIELVKPCGANPWIRPPEEEAAPGLALVATGDPCPRSGVRQATPFVAVGRQFDDERPVVRRGRIEDGAEVADRHIDPRYRGLAAPRRKNWEPP